MEKEKAIKIFLQGFAVSVAIFLSVNVLQGCLADYITSHELAKNPPIFLSANLSPISPVEKPVENVLNSSSSLAVVDVGISKENCSIYAQSALSVEIGGEGEEKIIFEKSSSQEMLIASLTKLMTGVIADEFYLPDYKIIISQQAIDKEEIAGELVFGEEMRVVDLLYSMLIESSNDAAFALSEPMGQGGMVSLMNLKAENLGLLNTYFVNPSGLDEVGECNYSTANDLVRLAEYVLLKPELIEIISKKELPLYRQDGTLHHLMRNTNELIGEEGVIGGKTGKTKRAGGCLLIISEGKNASSTKISVVLNSPDRFGDMRKILTCNSFQK